MSVDKVKKYLEQFEAADRVLEFDASSATVELAAAALKVKPERIAKTSFGINDSAILIVAAGDAKVDNQKYKARFGAKARMLSPTKRKL